MKFSTVFTCLIGIACLLAAASSQLAAQDKPMVLSTTTILHDMTRQVGGDAIITVCLLKPGVDAHTYEVTPQDVKEISRAKMVVINGLGFDSWADRLVRSSGYSGPVINVSKGVKTLETEHDDHEGHDHHHHGCVDPHIWQDVGNAIRMVANIEAGLAKSFPDKTSIFKANATAYTKRLKELDSWIKNLATSLPRADRKLVTAHDTFGYFGRAYGFDIIPVAGLSTEHEAAAKKMSSIAALIRKNKIKAVFFENVSNPKLMEQLARDTGVKMGGDLMTDSLAPSGHPAESYEGMMRYNVEKIISSLQ